MQVQMANPLGEAIFLLWAAAVLGLLLLAGLRLLQRKTMRSSLMLLVIVTAAYPAGLVASGLLSMERDLPLGSVQCFDDWCIQVLSVEPTSGLASSTSDARTIVASLRLSNQARRASFSPDHPQVELITGAGNSYAPSASGLSALVQVRGPQPALDTRLDAGQAVDTAVVFEIPAAERPAKMLVTEGTGPPIFGDQTSPLHAKTYVLVGDG